MLGILGKNEREEIRVARRAAIRAIVPRLWCDIAKIDPKVLYIISIGTSLYHVPYFIR